MSPRPDHRPHCDEPNRRDCLSDHRDSMAPERDTVATARENFQNTVGATAVEIKGLWTCLDRIEKSLNKNNELINNIFAKGCARAEAHERIDAQQDTRLLALEVAMAENRGRDRTLNALVSAVIAAAAVLFGRLFK